MDDFTNTVIRYIGMICFEQENLVKHKQLSNNNNIYWAKTVTKTQFVILKLNMALHINSWYIKYNILKPPNQHSEIYMGQFTYPDGKENHSLSFFCNWTHYINLIETIGKTKHITKFSISWNFLKEYCV